MTPATARIRFLPSDRVAACAPGDWLAATAARAGVAIVFDCDGQGVCSTCRVRVVDGADRISRVTAAERLQLDRAVSEGWRLACLVKVYGDVTLEVPPRGFAYPPELQRSGG